MSKPKIFTVFTVLSTIFAVGALVLNFRWLASLLLWLLYGLGAAALLINVWLIW